MSAMMGNKHDPRFNSSGYADPTAYAALKEVKREESDAERRVKSLVRIMRVVADEMGFDITNRIELRDRKTGRRYW